MTHSGRRESKSSDCGQVAMGKGYLDLRGYLQRESARMEDRKLQESMECPCEKVQGEERDHNPRAHDQSC